MTLTSIPMPCSRIKNRLELSATLTLLDGGHLLGCSLPDIRAPGILRGDTAVAAAELHPVELPHSPLDLHQPADIPMPVPVKFGADPIPRFGVPAHAEGAGPGDTAETAADTGMDDDIANHGLARRSRRLPPMKCLTVTIYLSPADFTSGYHIPALGQNFLVKRAGSRLKYNT